MKDYERNSLHELKVKILKIKKKFSCLTAYHNLFLKNSLKSNKQQSFPPLATANFNLSSDPLSR
jgi:hypothetical protein